MFVTKWATRRKKSDEPLDRSKFIYEAICVALVAAAIIYAVVNGSGVENSGFGD